MADLDPLIRLNKFELDEKQRFLSRLYSDIERLQKRKAGILDRIESEKDVADASLNDPMLIQSFLSYLQRVKKDIQIIDGEITRIEKRIEVAIEEMRIAFGELKKIEITRDRRLEELAAENKRREDIMFNEIALEMYRRQQTQ